MTSLRTRDIVALGFMTFALFIGAGNIIFPPIVAQQAGEHVWLAAFGFLITAVGLPVITIIALSRVEGSIQILSSPLGKIASLILTITCYLTVGPLFATPRTATVSYEIGFSSYLGTSSSSLLIYSAIYFSVVTLISLYPNKILDTVGYVLSPLKILSLTILGIAAMMIPTGFVPPAINNYIDSPVSEGFVNGYLTMDTLGALVFGIVIIQAIRSRGVSNPKLITRYAVIASIISGIGLTVVYLSLFKLGLGSHEVAANASNGAVILHAYVQHAFGDLGSIFLSAMIFIACMVTAIGLTCACAEYFSSITKIGYKVWVFILIGFSFIISNLGLTKLIAFSVPVLSAIYPPAIVVIMLSFGWKFFNHPRRVIAPVTAVSLVFGIVDGLKVANFELPYALTHLPLAEQNLAWLIPSLVVFVIAFVIDKVKK
ncbi:branched-chain amino acid transport system II carrier protein [Acinetobacter johnsonii]|jgi:branched-chain amino acid:cation transporter, LIVCS family|uniref:Branched-chain amino acid transport system carrier protein n=1 Tax=Acinetobacter johnsonii TaxID=40214 RepID=A0AA42QT60_ACIJO|nr:MULTISPECIES: branched-chain amino acid transport system II carrier protein [Acinetobacter]NWK47821.1 branched-chain amino acid transport system II carrier protein [Acinetobacter sp. SwsAc7]AXF45228.1 branched-chain amino acid transport system II carrier protein [Acinetobacter johnsonii]KUG38514.1 branched-chain amino acid ABC transporter substrate-binding protein [Acinetobacter johnsonii]MCU4327473.1 branched-chain amino acid transport system II carrier protein [Acinetobacter johnsonii]MDH